MGTGEDPGNQITLTVDDDGKVVLNSPFSPAETVFMLNKAIITLCMMKSKKEPSRILRGAIMPKNVRPL